ncbi:MAG: hypothetical protein GY866_21135, partial [Proteobacteria bacterium]|nr:hypothetical protein [Pseudomonadota bacterium]
MEAVATTSIDGQLAELDREIELREISQELARRDLFEFTKYTFRAYKRENWHHRLVAKYLQGTVDGEIKRLMLFAPPRHMKTESLERAFSFAMGKDTDCKIIITGYAATKARKISGHIKENVKDLLMKEVFPEFPGVNGADTQDNWELGNGHRGSLLAAGVGGSITGEGFNIAGIDDPVKDREQAESSTYQEKTNDWYWSTFLSRQDEVDSAIVISNTRWNTKD